jgi:hypothetical protein
MKRYISLVTLAALLGCSLAQDATTTTTTPSSTEKFLEDEKREVILKSAKAACKVYSDLTYWDLSTMTNKDENGNITDYTISLLPTAGYGADAVLHYNLCAYTKAQCNNENVFAYISRTGQPDICLTDDDLFVTKATTMFNDNGKKYLQFTQTGDQECASDDD